MGSLIFNVWIFGCVGNVDVRCELWCGVGLCMLVTRTQKLSVLNLVSQKYKSLRFVSETSTV